MPKILIIGDSWGVGSYKFVGNPPRAIEAIPNTGLDYFLRKAGVDVTNISQAGASNFSQLSKLEDIKDTYDYIVWFQTEITRDIIEQQYTGTNYSSLLKYALKSIYDKAQSIYIAKRIPFLVIGGLVSVDQSIQNYEFAKSVIDHWLKELTENKFDIPLNVHCNYIRQILEYQTFDDLDFVNSQLDKMLYLENVLETHPALSDGLHPKKDSYEQLADRIIKLLNITTNN